MTNKPGYVPGKLSNAQVIATCRFGHERCSELLHFQDTYEALRSRIVKLVEFGEQPAGSGHVWPEPITRQIREVLGEK